MHARTRAGVGRVKMAEKATDESETDYGALKRTVLQAMLDFLDAPRHDVRSRKGNRKRLPNDDAIGCRFVFIARPGSSYTRSYTGMEI